MTLNRPYGKWMQRRPKEKMGCKLPSTRIDCEAHRKFIKSRYCCLTGKTDQKTGELHVCWGYRDPHHTTTRGAGGGDETCVPLCRGGHDLLDSPGWSQKHLEERYGVDLKAIAAQLWEISPAGKKYRREREAKT